MSKLHILPMQQACDGLTPFWAKLLKRLLCVLILTPCFGYAQTSTDWGVIPTDGTYTYYFSGSDITKNFTDTYSFSLANSGETQYQMTIVYDSCTHGCGSVALDYGIYEGGTLIDDSGTAVLSSGNYQFKVTGTGMGAGNNLTYGGSITFTAIVSTVPEPSEITLFILSAGLLGWSVSRQRRARRLLPA